MLYFIFNSDYKGENPELAAVLDSASEKDMEKLRRMREYVPVQDMICRVNFTHPIHAKRVAELATKLTGKLHVPTDSGPYVSPRFDVIEAPKVGDDASYAFNGDYYPCGKITAISDSLRRIVATDEKGVKRVFWRRRQSGAWVYQGTWSLVQGHVSRLNPEF